MRSFTSPLANISADCFPLFVCPPASSLSACLSVCLSVHISVKKTFPESLGDFFKTNLTCIYAYYAVNPHTIKTNKNPKERRGVWQCAGSGFVFRERERGRERDFAIMVTYNCLNLPYFCICLHLTCKMNYMSIKLTTTTCDLCVLWLQHDLFSMWDNNGTCQHNYAGCTDDINKSHVDIYKHMLI